MSLVIAVYQSALAGEPVGIFLAIAPTVCWGALLFGTARAVYRTLKGC